MGTVIKFPIRVVQESVRKERAAQREEAIRKGIAKAVKKLRWANVST